MSPHLPIDELIPLRERPVLICPCDEVLARDANELTRAFYGSEVVPLDQYLSWLTRNPQILVCLCNSSGEVEGYFDVLPLEPRFMGEFIIGGQLEQDIRGADILSPAETSHCTTLYLAGIAVRHPEKVRYKRYASFLAWGLLKYLQHYYAIGMERSVYALASTVEGERLLRAFRFQVACGASKRPDGHNMYCCHLTDRILRDLAASIPDWTDHCHIDFKGGAAPPRVFLSYRREDAMAITGRIADRLRVHFGADSVFMDIDSVPFGADFRLRIKEAVSRCTVLLAVIGDNWLPLMTKKRAENKDDYVLTEIETALQVNIPVIPVLVGKTPMPDGTDLPRSIEHISYLNACPVDFGADFDHHMSKLIGSLDDSVRSTASGGL